MSEHISDEGYVNFNGYQTWYATHGDVAAATPLLVLHGGPGLPHDYLEGLAGLADQGHPVVFYDQLGCGRSDRPDDPAMWSTELFVSEVDVVREALGLETVNILGHSWGGALAIEYALTEPAGLERLVLHSPLLDSKLWVEEAERLKDLLPPGVAATMRQHEHAGTTDTQEYKTAYQVFKDNFVCRVKPRPEPLARAGAALGQQVYETMWGPSEDYATGKLKDWTVLDRLGRIAVPTLLTSGRYDEATPQQIALAHAALQASDWVIFEDSSHVAHLEETEAYQAAVSSFLGQPVATP